jgi:UDP-3-O-[3-hydroxymyristoyl] glucosamine N-acyltransferase
MRGQVQLTAGELAQGLGGLIIDIRGSADRPVLQARPASACQPGALTYLKPAAKGVSDWAAGLTGATVICDPTHHDLIKDLDVTVLVTENPRLAFMRAVDRFLSGPRPAAGVHPAATVDPDAVIDPTATLAAGCVVGAGCSVGARSILHANVVLYPNVRIGSDVTIHAGTVVGADGFGYERNDEGVFEKFPHIGGVVIEDDVEIGSNTSIDRGSLGDTIIRTGARIDNQCHISHNVEIGRHAAVIAQSMVGGSAKIGDYAWLAPAAIIMNQARVGDRAVVGLGAVVVKSVPEGETFMGSPAVPAAEFRATRDVMKSLVAKARTGE